MKQFISKFLKGISIFAFFCFLGACSTTDFFERFENKDIKKGEKFAECMKKISDHDKCKAQVETPETKFEQELKEEETKVYTTKDCCQIRKKIKNVLQGKNKIYVLSFLGEPEERWIDTQSQEHLIYRRPISQELFDSPPDSEIRVILRRDQVSQVIHHPPKAGAVYIPPQTTTTSDGQATEEKKQ